jgi:hypothetical protein
MDLRLANFQVLEQRFRQGTRVARNYLRKAYLETESTELNHLLRHHPDEDYQEEEVIDNQETWLRDSLDNLLTYYGVLEIACLIDFVHFPLPRSLEAEALLHLSQPAVHRYYPSYYPTLLPEAFRQRLTGEHDLREVDGDAAAYLFMDFLDVNTLIDDEDVDCFFWLLDSGVYDDGEKQIDIDDLLKVLETYDSFVEAVACRPSEQGYLEQAVQGLCKFLTFCPALEQLLDRAESHPYLQSAMWHHHGYWFGHLKEQVGCNLRTALQHLDSWKAEAASARESRESRQSIRQMARTVKRLTGREFDRPLRAALRANSRRIGLPSGRLNSSPLSGQ